MIVFNIFLLWVEQQQELYHVQSLHLQLVIHTINILKIKLCKLANTYIIESLISSYFMIS